jgi:hypothetical protein
MMFREIFFFEITYQVRRVSTWIYLAVIIALLYLVIKEMGEYAVNVEEVLINSPISIAEIAAFASKFSLLMIPALVADGAMRDTQKRMAQLIYSTPISKMSYIGGRVCGTLFVVTVMMLFILGLSILGANMLMDLESTTRGPLHVAPLINVFIFFVIPNAIIASLFLYGVTLLTRHAMAAYAGALIIFILSSFNIDALTANWPVAKLLDPFAGTIVDTFSMTLLLKDRNVAPVPVDKYLLANRLIWIGISIIIVCLAVVKFRLSHSIPRARLKKQVAEEADTIQAPIRIITPNRPFTFKIKFFQSVSTALRLYKEIVFSAAGIFIIAIAMYAYVLIPNLSEGPMGVSILSATDRIVLFIGHSALQIFVAILISLYAGQLIWRERDGRMGDIVDATPISDGWMFAIKFMSLTFLVVTVQSALLLSGILIQIKNDYYDFQPALYFSNLFGFQLTKLLMFAAVAMVLHVLINQKYLGHLATILFYFYTLLGPRFGLEHKLAVFGSDIGLAKSVFHDQSGYLYPWILFKSYWLGWTLLLIVIARLLWIRGHENSLGARIRKFQISTMSKPQVCIAVLLIISAGGIIYYNTNIRNHYQTNSDRVLAQVIFEQKYGRYRNAVQPYLAATKLKIDFFPGKQSADVYGTYSLKNFREKMIDSIHVVFPDRVVSDGISFNTSWTPLVSDSILGYYIYLLDEPLKPGDSIQMNFRLHYAVSGFSNRGISTDVMKDGSYFSRQGWLPSVGYQADREIADRGLRKKFGLPQHIAHELRDSAAVLNIGGREKITFDLIASTSAGQMVVAPGLLKNAWNEKGRALFHYVADSSIRNIYYVYSAKYAVRNAKWRNMPLRIYHRAADTLNLKTMEESMKASLEYYTDNFSPYNSTDLKLVQYADPGTGGISHPGTIGYSTNFARLNSSDPGGFDLPFAVVAHEIAHQWWGHQLLPADVKGAMFLSESLAWYSALCVVRKIKGEEHLDKLLDAMRADYYSPRVKADVPLLETVDPTRAYRKGPFAMYAMHEYIGEEKVNLALRRLLTKFGAKKLPLPTALDFYKELQAVTPDSLSYLVNDLFAFNTIWDLKTKSVSVTRAAARQWNVRLRFTAKKEIIDENGVATQLPMHEPIEVGIYKIKSGAQRQSLYLQRHNVKGGENVIDIVVSEQPAEAGIDPRNLLIDMNPYDNMKNVKLLFPHR